MAPTARLHEHVCVMKWYGNLPAAMTAVRSLGTAQFSASFRLTGYTQCILDTMIGPLVAEDRRPAPLLSPGAFVQPDGAPAAAADRRRHWHWHWHRHLASSGVIGDDANRVPKRIMYRRRGRLGGHQYDPHGRGLAADCLPLVYHRPARQVSHRSAIVRVDLLSR